MVDVIDINLIGAVYFARLATAYLKENHTFDEHTNGANIVSPKCITLISSVAGFIEAPGISTYAATKHGVLGLMRALRLYISQLYGIRINAICKYLPYRSDSRLSRCVGMTS
jgi:NAD(P)-dependent dehydrogenase (short-subunit alcohol dehydrogenase family)